MPPGKTLIVSEETEADWRGRVQLRGIRDHVYLLCRPFLAPPSHAQWLALIDTDAAMRERHGIDLVVFDSLAYFTPPQIETSTAALLECPTPLQRLTSAGMAVLLPHHPRRGSTFLGQAARGRGALLAHVEIYIEMYYYARPDELDRRRRLTDIGDLLKLTVFGLR